LALLLSSAACGPDLAVPVDVVTVRLVAQDRSWHASYVLATSTGHGVEVPTGREVHVPLGAGVHLALSSPDFISSFTVDDLDLRHFAAPDLPSQVTFFADRVGRHELRGDELCGRPHDARARGWLVIDRPADYQMWVRRQAREAR
jgi:heme/copper-type cytochrome/quinol oxidase subunit 2